MENGKLKKKTIIIIIINVLCLACIAVCQIVSANIKAPLHAGRAATAWAGQSGERYAQLAAYFPQSYNFDEEAIYNTRKSLDTSLLGASIEGGEERKLYADAWSAESSAVVIGERGTANASIIGVGGEFFLFHPLFLRNGSYISPDDVMRDRVVLDEDLAWRLYGSINLAGLEVLINDKPFVIAGVVTGEQGAAYHRAKSVDKAYQSGAGLFMSFEALSALTDGKATINSYEAVIPDVVTDFAITTLQSALTDESIIIVDNSSRFTYANLFKIVGAFGERGLQTSDIIYPYWENAVRYAEDWLAMLLFVSLMLLVCPIVFSVIYIVKLIRFGFGQSKKAVRAQIKKRDDRAYARFISTGGKRAS